MQIVIDIRPELYAGIKAEKNMWTELELAVLDGTPLPEHYGRLIDADALEQEMIIAEGKAEGDCDYYMSDVIDRAKEYIIDAETIIPATKEGDEE